MLQINDQHGCTFSVIMFALQLARDKDFSFLTNPIVLWAEGNIYIGTSRLKKKKKSLNMLHFVSLTFFMQHLFAFLVFQENTQLPVCFGGPRQRFRPLFSLDLTECSILPWDPAGVWDGMCPAVCTLGGGPWKFALWT